MSALHCSLLCWEESPWEGTRDEMVKLVKIGSTVVTLLWLGLNGALRLRGSSSTHSCP